MSIPAVGAVGFTPYVPPTVPTTPTQAAPAAGLDGADPSSAAGAAGGAGTDFAKLLSNGMENLQTMHSNVDSLALQAATGNLNAIHDYTIAATQASVATQLTTAVRNKALESFQEIMRMSV
ncbi:MAG TPA: flagellar hook-basal body complex protein FliE [Nocardioidaceae bacterium]|jgi:flagellar hook-basal body complex protein FliE|nr:flagellar hook-basal body complex protein FliE [Nocardioidaceae bacterium]